MSAKMYFQDEAKQKKRETKSSIMVIANVAFLTFKPNRKNC